MEFLNWLLDLPWWAWGAGIIAWLCIAFVTANLFGEMCQLGGRNDIQDRRRARNIRTVEAEKRQRALMADHGLKWIGGKPPDLICYDCLWRGAFGDAAFKIFSGDSESYCPECKGELEAYDATLVVQDA